MFTCLASTQRTCLDPWLTDVSGRCPVCQRPVEIPGQKTKKSRDRTQNPTTWSLFQHHHRFSVLHKYADFQKTHQYLLLTLFALWNRVFALTCTSILSSIGLKLPPYCSCTLSVLVYQSLTRLLANAPQRKSNYLPCPRPLPKLYFIGVETSMSRP